MTKEEIWLERVVAWRASGVSAAEFCAGASFDVRTLWAWSSRLGREGKVPRGRHAKKAGTPKAMRFAQVSTMAPVNKETVQRSLVIPESGGERARLSVAVGGSRVEVSDGFDPFLLRAVVAALGEGGA